MDKVLEFQGGHRFLSNFYPALVYFEGRYYETAEAAYQAAKTLDLDARVDFQHLPGTHDGCRRAKRMGRLLKVRPDWNQVRVGVMRLVVRDKFTEHPRLGEQLMATGDAHLEEGNWWGDRFWGVSPVGSGIGANNLGKILMDVRAELVRARDQGKLDL